MKLVFPVAVARARRGRGTGDPAPVIQLGYIRAWKIARKDPGRLVIADRLAPFLAPVMAASVVPPRNVTEEYLLRDEDREYWM